MVFTIAGVCAEFIRILVTVSRPLSYAVLDFFYGLVMGRTRELPPLDNKILLMSAAELAEKIRKRQLSCEEVMRAYVERAMSVHPCVNAAVDERYEDALLDAREVDALLEGGDKSEDEIERETPLLGVPFTFKEAAGVKGMTQTGGLVRAKGRKAEKDGDAAALLRKAGAIPLTVTDVPTLCMWWESSNRLYGLTRNAYDNRRTVGGSSGGEGALITAAGAVIGVGNDIAGSIRIPASFCGIYGHKPSRGVVPNLGTYPFCYMERKEEDRTNEFVSTGPMCRYVQDIPLMMRVLSDNDERIRLDQQVDFRKVKVYYMEELPGYLNRAIPDVKSALKKAVQHFECEFSIRATPLRIDELEYAFPIWECKMLEHGSSPFRYLMDPERGGPNLWLELLKSVFQRSEFTLPAIYFGMVDRRNKDDFYHGCLRKYKEIERVFDEIFKEDAVLLVPTHPEPPPHYLMTIPLYPNIGYTCIFNVLGLPSSQIPAGLSRRGLPIGLQAVSGRFRDHLSIAAALELDKVFGGWIVPGVTV